MNRRRHFADLIRELAVTEFKLKYEGSVLGYLWSFAKPLMLFLVLYFVFDRFLHLGGSIPNYPVYLLLGVVLWSYFADATTAAMGSIVDRQDLIRKIPFPKLAIVLAASVSSLITLLLNLVVISLFMLALRVTPQISAPLFLLLVVELYVLALGCSLLLAALFVKFRDFRHIWEVVLQVLFYLTPIIYPISILPPSVRVWLMLNPLAQVFQDARFLLVTPDSITAHQVLTPPLLIVAPYIIPPVLLVAGWLYFRAAAPSFAEEV